MRPPRFMEVCHRIFEGKTAFQTLFESFTGFPDEILYAIAQTSELAFWKSQELLKGTLTTLTLRELIRRGEAIEQDIKQIQGTTATSNGLSLDLGLIAGPSLFKESALLYLHTTLSDLNPHGSVEM